MLIPHVLKPRSMEYNGGGVDLYRITFRDGSFSFKFKFKFRYENDDEETKNEKIVLKMIVF